MFGSGRPFLQSQDTILKWLDSPNATRSPEIEQRAVETLYSMYEASGWPSKLWQIDSAAKKMWEWARGKDNGRRDNGLKFIAWAGITTTQVLEHLKSELSMEMKQPTTRLSTETTAAVVEYFGKQKSLTLVSIPTEALAHPKPMVRVAALNALTEIGEANSAIPAILNALRDDDIGVREAAVLTLERGSLKPGEVKNAYKGYYGDKLTENQRKRVDRVLARSA